jgi:hypothetical protein
MKMLIEFRAFWKSMNGNLNVIKFAFNVVKSIKFKSIQHIIMYLTNISLAGII